MRQSIFALPSTAIRLFLLLLFCSPMLQAQSDYSQRKATSRLSVGAGASLGVALPTGGSFKDTSEAAPGLGFRVGLNITYPLTRSIGAIFNVGLDSRAIGKKPKGANDNKIWRANYLFLEPGVSISAFRLSLNIGLPMSLSGPDSALSGDTFPSTSGDALEKMIELRIGGTLVLLDRQESWLGLTLDAGFPFNTFYAKSIADVFTENIPSMHAFSAHIGLTYQFAIPGTGGL